MRSRPHLGRARSLVFPTRGGGIRAGILTTLVFPGPLSVLTDLSAQHRGIMRGSAIARRVPVFSVALHGAKSVINRSTRHKKSSLGLQDRNPALPGAGVGAAIYGQRPFGELSKTRNETRLANADPSNANRADTSTQEKRNDSSSSAG